MERKLYSELATAIQARKNCAAKKPKSIPVPDINGLATRFVESDEMVNPEWFDKWTERIEMLVDLLPSGSGIDSGTKLDLDASHAEKLVFQADFHHMNDGGFYDGWTEHRIVVTPSFTGINLRISGPNRNDIKDYLYKTYDYALKQDVTYQLLLPDYPEYAVTSKWENEDGSASQSYQAFYAGTRDVRRFWNRPDEARAYATELMLKAQKAYRAS